MNKLFSSKTGLVQICEDNGTTKVKVGRGTSKGTGITDLPLQQKITVPVTQADNLRIKCQELIEAAKTYTGRDYTLTRFISLDGNSNYFMILESKDDELVYRYTVGSEGGTNLVISAKGRQMWWALKCNYQNSWDSL